MIDLTQQILDRRGVVAKDKLRVIENDEYVMNEFNKEKEEVIPLTLGVAMANCLLQVQVATEEDAVKVYTLFKKVEGAKEIDLSEEELKLVKESLCQNLSTYFAGTILSLINK